MKKVLFTKQDGLTLIEVLAALVILGILFVGIMSVFPQMTLFNVKTEAKLDTMNLARQEMADVTERTKWEKQLIALPAEPTAEDIAGSVPDHLTEPKISTALTGMGYTLTATDTDYFRYQKTGDFLYELDVYNKCTLYSDSTLDATAEETANTGECSVGEKKKLYKVHLKIFNENTATPGSYYMSSETFSYLTYNALPPLPVPVVSEGG